MLQVWYEVEIAEYKVGVVASNTHVICVYHQNLPLCAVLAATPKSASTERVIVQAVGSEVEDEKGATLTDTAFRGRNELRQNNCFAKSKTLLYIPFNDPPWIHERT